MAQVAETVPVAGDWKGRIGDRDIGDDDVGGARFVDINHENDRRGLGEAVDKFVAGTELHVFLMVARTCRVVGNEKLIGLFRGNGTAGGAAGGAD